MDREGPSISFAGPHFSAAERTFNTLRCARIEASGFAVFLPQRDGSEGDRPPSDAMPRDERRRAMCDLDVSEIEACDVFLAVLDGRVSDEGA